MTSVLRYFTVPFWSTFSRFQLAASRRSWRIYSSQHLVVEDRGVRVPVSVGVGMDMIGEPEYSLGPLLRRVYSQRRGAFIDVGVNIGRVLITLIRMDRSIPYVGFEPMIKAANHADLIIRENGLTATHTILPVALSDRTGTATILSNGATDVSATINQTTRPAGVYRLRSSIVIVRGDDMLADVPGIACLKIDAEGAEVSVLRGLERTIRQHRPVIMFEVLPIKELEDNTYSREAVGELGDDRFRLAGIRRQHAAEIRSILESFGYHVMKFDGQAYRDADLTSSNYENCDFVALPEQDETVLRG